MRQEVGRLGDQPYRITRTEAGEIVGIEIWDFTRPEVYVLARHPDYYEMLHPSAE